MIYLLVASKIGVPWKNVR